MSYRFLRILYCLLSTILQNQMTSVPAFQTVTGLFTALCAFLHCLDKSHQLDYGFTVRCLSSHYYQSIDGCVWNDVVISRHGLMVSGIVWLMNLSFLLPQMTIVREYHRTDGEWTKFAIIGRNTPDLLLASWCGKPLGMTVDHLWEWPSGLWWHRTTSGTFCVHMSYPSWDSTYSLLTT